MTFKHMEPGASYNPFNPAQTLTSLGPIIDAHPEPRLKALCEKGKQDRDYFASVTGPGGI
jgi:hypothetical protein